MNSPVVATIGGGKISEQHLASLCNMGPISVRGICDLSSALAQFTADRFGVSHWYTNYRQMLQEIRPDVVHVLTPPATHDRLVRDCLLAGANVIVEKPIALSNRSFNDLWNLAVEQRLALVENHNYRFNRPIQQLTDAVNAGRIGRVEEVDVHMALNIRAGGRYSDENMPHPSHQLPAGVIHEFVTHLAYLLLHFLPQSYETVIDTVRAAWRNHGGGELFKYDDLDAMILAGNAHGRLRFSTRGWPDSFSVQVRGSDGVGTAELYNPMCQVTTRRSVGQHLTPLINSLSGARNLARSGFGSIWSKVRNQGAYEGLSRFLALTYAALQGDEELPVTYRHMNGTTRLVDQLLAEENRV